MNIMNIIISLLIGSISGWLAGKIMDSEGSLLRNIILGIIGGFLGSFIFDLLGITFAGYLGTILVSVLGACLIILIVNKILKL